MNYFDQFPIDDNLLNNYRFTEFRRVPYVIGEPMRQGRLEALKHHFANSRKTAHYKYIRDNTRKAIKHGTDELALDVAAEYIISEHLSDRHLDRFFLFPHGPILGYDDDLTRRYIFYEQDALYEDFINNYTQILRDLHDNARGTFNPVQWFNHPYHNIDREYRLGPNADLNSMVWNDLINYYNDNTNYHNIRMNDLNPEDHMWFGQHNEIAHTMTRGNIVSAEAENINMPLQNDIIGQLPNINDLDNLPDF